jgi:TetR/AcrR family transcriptional regulator, lmrAB and yxaGH operons repressor
MPKDTYIPQLLSLFQQHGYDGATLAKIATATGLGKASLYHHFPGGKDEMVEAVLAALAQGLTQHILPPLAGPGDAQSRLQQMCDRAAGFYQQGERPCLLAILLLGSARDLFQQRVQGLLQIWISAIAQVFVEAGLPPTAARERAEDALITLQGALVLAQGLGDTAIFQRAVQQLPARLCCDLTPE